MKSIKNTIKSSARFIVSFGAIGIILYLFREQLPTVLDHLSNANPYTFALAVLIFMVGLIGVAFRLKMVLKIHNADLSVTNLYYMNLVALFFNNILPSHAGGEMVKAYYIYKGSNKNVAAFGGVIIDRLFGLITMVLIGVAAIFLYDGALASPKILSSVMMLALFTAAFCFMLFNQKVVGFLCRLHIPLVPKALLDKLRDIYQAMHHYRGHKRIVVTCIGLTLIGQTSFVFTNYFLAKSLGIAIPLGFFFYFIPIIMMLGLAPSINGIGVREAAYLFYLTGFTSSEMALALSLLTSFFMVFVGIVGGILYAFKGGVPSMKEMIQQDTDIEKM